MTPGNASSGGLGAETAAPSDADLLHSHVEGDPQAFAELVRRHRDRLWAVALRTIGDREEAADAVQDALLAAHRNAARFRGDSAVTTWLHRIVVNACLDRIRRRQAHPTVPLPDGTRSDDRPTGVEPAAPIHDHDTALVVRAALAALPLDQRAAIVLVDVQGYPVAEAAEILGVAEGTIKSRCARGRARMAQSLSHLRPAGNPAKPTPARDAAKPTPARDAARPKSARDAAQPTTAGSEPTTAGDPSRPISAVDPSQLTSAEDLGQPTSADEPSQPTSADDLGQPISADGPNQPTSADDSGLPISAGDSGRPADGLGDSARPGLGGSAGADDDGRGDSGLARDTGHAADGNRGGARSVPSGPAAASVPRPSAQDRRDQR